MDCHVLAFRQLPHQPKLFLEYLDHFERVKSFYFHPPATKYEEIAMLDTSSKGGFGFTAQGKTDIVINRLKEEAAKLGANGVLIQGVGDQPGGSVSTGFGQANAYGNHATAGGIGFSGNVTHKVGSGIAIYVEPN